MRIGLAYSLAPTAPATDGPDDRFEEFDKQETVDAIARSIGRLGHRVELLGDGRELVSKVMADPPDFVFNIAEGQGAGRCREARVPALLEMLGIPYGGSDPLTLAATLDKSVAKRLVREVVAVPDEAVIPVAAGEPEAREKIDGLYRRHPGGLTTIVKPALEGSSKGIRGECLADSPGLAWEIARRLLRDYGQPALVEQFIDGDEITVGLVGNGPSLRVLGAMRVLPTEQTERFVYSLEVKRDWRRRVRYEVPARVVEREPGLLSRSAIDAFEALGCRDFARVDFRVRDGVPYFLEANPLPGLAPGTSDLVILADGLGVLHDDLIRTILGESLVRRGLAPG